MNVEKITCHQWEHPCNILVSGPTKCGKTQWILKLCRARGWIFTEAIKKILFIFTMWQPLYDEMDKEFGDCIKWSKGLPEDPFTHFKSREPGLIIIDDMMSEIEGNSRNVSRWFTRGSHHENVSMAVLVQNLFPKNMRTISLNAHVCALFNNPRDQSQTTRFLVQSYEGHVQAVKKCIEQHVYKLPHSPAIFNFFQSTPREYSIMCDIFPEDLKRSNQPFPQVLLYK